MGAQAGKTPPAIVENAVCAGCHEVDPKFAKSAHAAVSCASCHQGYNEAKHPEGMIKPQCASCHAGEAEGYATTVHGEEVKKGNTAAPDCGVCHGEKHDIGRAHTADYKKAEPELCGMCHTSELEQYKTSVHGEAIGKNILDAPVCSDCHTAHNILRVKNPNASVAGGNLPTTCGSCHNDVRLMKRFNIPANRVSSFNQSFHGLSLQAGSQSVADCASCHGYHNILPSTDPRSTISPKNIAATCGHCHAGAGTKFQIGKIHVVDLKDEPKPVQWATMFYMMVIPGTLGFMFVHQFGDFIRKMFFMRFHGQLVPKSMAQPRKLNFRMHRGERIQHLLLLSSFLVLVYTGFALHYADEWWSRPLLHWEKNYPVRGVIHRVAGIVMIVTSLIHVISIAVDKNLREHWKELFPRVSDVREMYENTMYRVGLRRQKPRISAHSYIEKMEYWALVWGTAVMAGTGVALWSNQWMLMNASKEWLDFARVVHYYEAILAFGSIIIWHWYMVIFDPVVYPMDSAWVTGYSPRPEEAHGHHEHKHAPPKDPATDKPA